MNTTTRAIGASANVSASDQKRYSVVETIAEATGRVLLASLFLLSGLGKLGAYSKTVGYMSSFGVPSALLPLVVAVELLGALAIVLGWKTRIVAFVLGGFSLLSALTTTPATRCK